MPSKQKGQPEPSLNKLASDFIWKCLVRHICYAILYRREHWQADDVTQHLSPFKPSPKDQARQVRVDQCSDDHSPMKSYFIFLMKFKFFEIQIQINFNTIHRWQNCDDISFDANNVKWSILNVIISKAILGWKKIESACIAYLDIFF